MSVILQANELKKSYGNLEAVKGISFSIDEGEVFSLLGPNGAGKTTTISMLSTLLPPSAGDAEIGGFSIKKHKQEVRRLIGVVPQEIALYETLNARENLFFWGRMYGMHGAELSKRVDEIIEQVELTEKAKAQVKTFSGGMKRRLNIGVGLLHKPRIIFMDEPTVGIDPQSRRNILDAVKLLNKSGMTVLYTTHYMEEAQEISDRVGIIDHGELIACGTQKELTKTIGEHETLRLEIGGEHDPAGVADALGKLKGVTQSSAVEHEVILIVPEAEDALPGVITKTNDMNVKVKSVRMEEPNLEAVFLRLTGRALRD